MPFDPARADPVYLPDAARYGRLPYRRVGASGIQLPAISLGLWQNFGDDRPLAGGRAILRRAFDLGITHFDLANTRASSALIGASSVSQLEQNFAALSNLEFSSEELGEIERHAVDSGINIWEPSSNA